MDLVSGLAGPCHRAYAHHPGVSYFSAGLLAFRVDVARGISRLRFQMVSCAPNEAH